MGNLTFIVSWVLTWFSHDLENLDNVAQIFDACLSQHPLFPLYLAIATILYNKERLYEKLDETGDIFTACFTAF